MQFRTIVKDPEVLEKYFSPLFLNLKEGECLEEYRQNKAVDDFLNAIPKTYEAEDLKAFYEKTGIKVEHQRFWEYGLFLRCNPSGSMPELDIMDLQEMSEDEIEEISSRFDIDCDDIAIELREGDWENWQCWEELEENIEKLLQKYIVKAYHQRAIDLVESEQFHELGQFEHNVYYALLITRRSQMATKLEIPSENLPNSGVFTIVIKDNETWELDARIAEIKAVLTKKLEDWQEHLMNSILGNLERCREHLDKQRAALVEEYVQGISERYY